MSRIFITGSSSGLGLMVAQKLIADGHQVVLHGRKCDRLTSAATRALGAEAAVLGDVSSLVGMRRVADQVNRLGEFDAVIHNVGVGYREPSRVETDDHLPHVFSVNVIAPYVLTALIQRPRRLIYLSSAAHFRADVMLDDILWTKRPWNGYLAYAESKLHDLLLAFAIARLWPTVLSNAVHPGWVPTPMGGSEATDDLHLAHLTQAWLATSNEPMATVTGEYFYHQSLAAPKLLTRDPSVQNDLLEVCSRLSGIPLAT